MIKKITTLFIIISPLMAYSAGEINTFPQKSLEIVPLSSMDLPEKFKQDLLKRKREEKQTGYQHITSEYANFLLNLNIHAPAELNSIKYIKNPMDTHLKRCLQCIPLVFKFNKISWVKQKNIIGYAPIGTYIESVNKKLGTSGWTGIKIFFTNSQLGICSYSFFNLKASHGRVQLNKESTEYIVNKKPSSKSIEGNYDSGFLYGVNWYGDGTMNELECAKRNFNKKTIDNVVKLANKIDQKNN